jgi:hypothetical protein
MKADFLLIRIGLFSAPVLAAAISLFFRRRRFPTRLAIVAATMLLLYLAIACVGLRFVSVRSNLACTVAAYFAYSLLTVMCLRIPQRWVRLLTFAMAIIPIGCGYLLTTIRLGVFALVIVVGFYSAKPNQVEAIAPGLTCRMTEQGWGGQTDSIYAIGLYQSWNWAPILARKVIGVLGVRNNADAEAKVVSCADLIARYEKS